MSQRWKTRTRGSRKQTGKKFLLSSKIGKSSLPKLSPANMKRALKALGAEYKSSAYREAYLSEFNGRRENNKYYCHRCSFSTKVPEFLIVHLYLKHYTEPELQWIDGWKGEDEERWLKFKKKYGKALEMKSKPIKLKKLKPELATREWKITGKKIDAPISLRNKKIIELVKSGKSTPRLIAKQLNLAEKTIDVELKYLRSLGLIKIKT